MAKERDRGRGPTLAVISHEGFDARTFHRTLREAREAKGLSRPQFCAALTEAARRSGMLRRLPDRSGRTPRPGELALSAVYITALEGAATIATARPTARTLLLLDQILERGTTQVLWKAAGFTPAETSALRADPGRAAEVRALRTHEETNALRLVRMPDLRRSTGDVAVVAKDLVGFVKDDEEKTDKSGRRIRPTRTGFVTDVPIKALGAEKGDILVVEDLKARSGHYELHAGQRSWELVRHLGRGTRVVARSGKPAPHETLEPWGVVTRRISVRQLV